MMTKMTDFLNTNNPNESVGINIIFSLFKRPYIVIFTNLKVKPPDLGVSECGEARTLNQRLKRTIIEYRCLQLTD
jgi:hypothetical protein